MLWLADVCSAVPTSYSPTRRHWKTTNGDLIINRGKDKNESLATKTKVVPAVLVSMGVECPGRQHVRRGWQAKHQIYILLSLIGACAGSTFAHSKWNSEPCCSGLSFFGCSVLDCAVSFSVLWTTVSFSELGQRDQQIGWSPIHQPILMRKPAGCRKTKTLFCKRQSLFEFILEYVLVSDEVVVCWASNATLHCGTMAHLAVWCNKGTKMLWEVFTSCS